MSNPDIEEFLGALSEMPDEYLQCRTMQHSWREEGEGFVVVDSIREATRRPRGGEAVFAERRLVCRNCGMHRSDAYQITTTAGHTALRKVSATYIAPPNYYVKGAGSLSKELVLGAKFDRDVHVLRRGVSREGGNPE